MGKYILVTDATVDLPSEILERLNIISIPMEFSLDGIAYKHYSDCREMKLSDFYESLKAGKRAKTSQINYYTYEEVFKPYLEQGFDILYLCFSSGLSGTYNASQNAINDLKLEHPNRKIVSIDTKCASAGEGLLVYNAGLLYQNGASFEEVEKYARDNHLNICHWFVVDDLEQLRSGGRITALQAAFGSVLQLKPLLSVDNDGKLVPVAKLRGRKRIIDQFLELLQRDAFSPTEQTVIVGHTNNLELATLLAEKLSEDKLVKEVIISEIGPVIGTHVGQGMIALTFMGNRNLTKL